jgi:hypothetical protein
VTFDIVKKHHKSHVTNMSFVDIPSNCEGFGDTVIHLDPAGSAKVKDGKWGYVTTFDYGSGGILTFTGKLVDGGASAKGVLTYRGDLPDGSGGYAYCETQAGQEKYTAARG